MLEKITKFELKPGSSINKVCLVMDGNVGEIGSALHNHGDEIVGRWSCRTKRHMKKKIGLVYLLKVICASRETCLDWLKNRGLIPRIMFCPICSRKMKFETSELAIDGYIWMCKECTVDPPHFSTRHGSWLESKDAPLVDILVFTYLWSHGFSEDQICKETNMPMNVIKEWNIMYSNICESLYERNRSVDEESGNGNNNADNKESRAAFWQRKNKYKDPFLEFLKDADSL